MATDKEVFDDELTRTYDMDFIKGQECHTLENGDVVIGPLNKLGPGNRNVIFTGPLVFHLDEFNSIAIGDRAQAGKGWIAIGPDARSPFIV